MSSWADCELARAKGARPTSRPAQGAWEWDL